MALTEIVNVLLPKLLDPLFDYLEDNLPPNVYQTLLTVSSNVMALSMIGARVAGVLLGNLTKSWDSQAILPPILTLFAAYIALTGFYRTTSWAFRTTFWMLKWGSIIGFLSMGAGWLAAVTQMNGNGQQDVAAILGDLGSKAAGWLSGESTKTATRPRSPRKEGSRNSRPWNTKFTSSANKNSRKGRTSQSDMEEAQKIMSDIVNSANQVFEGNWWWEMGKSVMGGGSEDQSQKRSQGRTRSR